MDFRCVHLLQFFNVCDHNVSFPDSLRVQRITEKYTWQDFCSKLMQSWLVLRRNKVIFDHCSKRYYWSVENGIPNRLSFGVFPSETRDLECFANSSSIPSNPPTIRYPDWTAIAPQMSLLSLCAMLFQQTHLFLICVALTCNDSRRDLNKLCQIQRNWQCKRLWVSSSALGTSQGSSWPLDFLWTFCFSCVLCVRKPILNLIHRVRKIEFEWCK